MTDTLVVDESVDVREDGDVAEGVKLSRLSFITILYFSSKYFQVRFSKVYLPSFIYFVFSIFISPCKKNAYMAHNKVIVCQVISESIIAAIFTAVTMLFEIAWLHVPQIC